MKTKTLTKEKDHAKDQASAQLESIQEMVKALSKNGLVGEQAVQTIQEDALSVEVRTGWYEAGQANHKAEEFNILLCTGGPAVRIVGTLSGHAEPESARLEYQDWGTPWTEYRLTADEEKDVVRYASCFYYRE